MLSLARSTISSSTTLFSNNRKVQRARPLGGLEQAKAISLASFSPSKIRATAGVARCLRLNTASKPSSTNCLRTRQTMDALVSKASMIRPSLHPSPASETSAFNNIRAFSSRCAGLFSLPDQRFKMFAFLATQPYDIFLYRNLPRRHDGLHRYSLGHSESANSVQIE